MEQLKDDLTDKIIRFSDCYILKDEGLIRDDLWVRNGRFIDGQKLFFSERKQADIIFHLKGCVISPGFIDIQVNGGYGYDFSDPSACISDVCFQIARRLPETGVTSFCPTIITSSRHTYGEIISQFGAYEDRAGCARMLGLHLEGPFISKLRSGMHPLNRIIEFGDDPIETLIETYGNCMDPVRIVTVAPELHGCCAVISRLVSKNIVVSVGHTDADCAALEQAITAGATFMTHLFNCMPIFHHRSAHIFGGIINPDPPLYVGLIADLVHLHPAALRVADAIAPGHVILVTDALVAFGLPDGSYTFGEQNIEVKDGKAYLAGTDHFAGGTTPLSTCIRNFWLEVCRPKHSKTDSPNDVSPWPGLGEALAAASTRPARGLRLYQKPSMLKDATNSSSSDLVRGALVPGADADFVILRPESSGSTEKSKLDVLSTWIAGKPVFTAPNVNFCIIYR
ncbi:unnamed protein product [Calicophoron daubneyi]|uniref:N-acetylglucosamine-6-phosphate deacetylase n=1 Tax=Calicophoron daubneyi TaxID=300641 RepID=A0AAV2TZC7_CALDB